MVLSMNYMELRKVEFSKAELVMLICDFLNCDIKSQHGVQVEEYVKNLKPKLVVKK